MNKYKQIVLMISKVLEIIMYAAAAVCCAICCWIATQGDLTLDLVFFGLLSAIIIYSYKDE